MASICDAPRMREIRVCWSPDVEHQERGVFRDGRFWYADAPEIRAALRLIITTENLAHGEHTHWIEQRGEADDDFVISPCWSSDQRRRIALLQRRRLRGRE
jgi:hypothetical protein